MADAFDALTTRQPYREARSTFEALKIMSTEMKGISIHNVWDFVKVFQI
jgi:HD-GYP domain-containing protein (c-di-GMP phosphodiesterase class II)